MASFASVLIDALRDALRADTRIKALVGANVYDVVPGSKGVPGPPVNPPWIYIGPIGGPRFEDSNFRSWHPRVRFFCASDDFNRSSAWDMVDAIDAVLDRATLELPAPFGMQSPLAASGAGDVIDPTKPRVAFCDFECVIYREEPFAPDSI